MAYISEKYLSGMLLLAMPGLEDPRFNKAVILICSHDKEGAMGLIINNEIEEFGFHDLMVQMGIEAENSPEQIRARDVPVIGGGPVEPARGFLLHSQDFEQSDTVNIGEHFGLTGTVEGLKKIAAGDWPEKMLFILGYSGWESGQLENEIKQNSWLIVDAEPELVFNSQPKEIWSKSLKKLGIEPSMLSSGSGKA